MIHVKFSANFTSKKYLSRSRSPEESTPTVSRQTSPERRAKPKRKTTKRNTPLWEYFKQEAYSREVRPRALCKTCHGAVKRGDGSTSGMKSHLRTHHKELYKEYLQKEDARLPKVSMRPEAFSVLGRLGTVYLLIRVPSFIKSLISKLGECLPALQHFVSDLE